MTFTVHQLHPEDTDRLHAMLDLFGVAFDQADIYGNARPGAAYLGRLLRSPTFIALVAMEEGGSVIGGLAAYELPKFEQERSEIYIYDLAVDAAHRRRGVATALIREVQRIAAERGAWVIFVQADQGDDPAIALYSGLGAREEVVHFDVPVHR